MGKTVFVAGGLGLAGLILMTSVLSQSGVVSWQPFQATRVVVEYSSHSGQLETSALPAPGILPDNPFYLLKMGRDRIQIWLRRDPRARAELYIDLADKRSETAFHLEANKQTLLAQSTMMKAYQYLERAMAILNQRPDDTAPDREIKERIRQVTEKHLARLDLMSMQVEGDARITYERIIESYRVLWLSL